MAELKDLIQQISKLPSLPGFAAHEKMAPYRKQHHYRFPEEAKQSSVLLLLFKRGDNIFFPLIQRQDYNGTHGGQIGFPGGKLEMNESPLEAALRETHEEVGIASHQVPLATSLSPLYIPPSNYLVTPFIGYCETVPEFVPDPREVARVIEIDLLRILNPKATKETKVKISKASYGITHIKTPCFEYDNEIIWGATACILNEFKELLIQLNYDLSNP